MERRRYSKVLKSSLLVGLECFVVIYSWCRETNSVVRNHGLQKYNQRSILLEMDMINRVVDIVYHIGTSLYVQRNERIVKTFEGHFRGSS
jgi:hypothetical protein